MGKVPDSSGGKMESDFFRSAAKRKSGAQGMIFPMWIKKQRRPDF
jgi:hypothetical protein